MHINADRFTIEKTNDYLHYVIRFYLIFISYEHRPTLLKCILHQHLKWLSNM